MDERIINMVLAIIAIVIAAMVFVLIYDAVTEAETIILQWDQPEDCDGCIDGVKIYQAIRAVDPDTGNQAHEFDYDFPVADVPAGTSQAEIDLPGRPGQDTKYVFTARAYRVDNYSDDSNIVSYVVSLVSPFPASDLSGGYDDEQQIISLAWEQPADEFAWRTISHWIVYWRIGDGEWTAIGTINAEQELILEAPFDAVAPGETEDVDFTVVSYRRSGVYSANSSILTLTIDRREVPPIENLRINIEVPLL